MLKFSRTKWVGIERPAKNVFLIHGTLEDHIYGLELDLTVKAPELTILNIEGKMRRITTSECAKAIPVLKKAIGLCLTAPDFSRQVNKIIGQKGCRHFANLLLECTDAVFRCALYETWEYLQKEGALTEDNFRQEVLGNLPFLKESCFAFTD
jgi:hypothetical protein